ncbi:MAG: BON domain-containing protein [Deltaproteobacteria bacterium]|nr:BON domain-containing protein [Deltaproteobacteria bacterium]
MTMHQIAAVFLSLILGAAACGRSDEKTDGVPATSSETKTGTAPATNNETKTSQAPATTKGTKAATKMSNADLENAVKAKLNADEQLRAADLGVSANADKNEITLSGSVQSQELHAKAIELAKSAHSGVTVNDQIEGSPGPRHASQNKSGSSSSGTDMAQGRSGDDMGGQAGASKDNVKEVQEALTDKGHDPGKIDGIMGPNTRAALRAFQKQNNLEASGTIDAKTASALGVETSAAPSK